MFGSEELCPVLGFPEQDRYGERPTKGPEEVEGT